MQKRMSDEEIAERVTAKLSRSGRGPQLDFGVLVALLGILGSIAGVWVRSEVVSAVLDSRVRAMEQQREVEVSRYEKFTTALSSNTTAQAVLAGKVENLANELKTTR